MEALRRYLKTLTPDEQRDYALRSGTTIRYLRKALSIGQRFKAELAFALADNSHGYVSRKDLRPDLFENLVSA